MSKLERCKCGQIAVVYYRRQWMCKVCEAILKSPQNRAPGFVLVGDGWPGKEIKNGGNSG